MNLDQNIYQLSAIYLVKEPNLHRIQPATTSFLYSHKENYSMEEFSSILNSLFEKHDGILVNIDKDLQNEFNFEPIKPIHVSFSGGTVSKESLEEIMGQKF